MTTPLSDDDASEIADLLSLLEDWLLHADQHVLERLGRYVWPGTCAQQQYVGGLIDRLREHSHRPTQQLTATNPDGESDGGQNAGHSDE